MLVLCPNHHTALDRGVLSINHRGTRWVSRNLGDGLHGKTLALKHPLNLACVG